MRVLVLGGTGFVGTSVVSQLRDAGHEVVVFHRGSSATPTGVSSIAGDRHDLDASRQPLRAARPDLVMDLIASSGWHAAGLMRVFRGATGRLIIASSIDVYRAASVLHGLEAGGLEPTPLTETSSLRTSGGPYPPAELRRLKSVFPWLDDHYDKLAVEQVVANDPALPSTVLRLPMIYGPGDRLNRMRPLVKRMADGRAAMLLPERLARWRGARGYVENVAAAIVLAATRPEAAGRTYNVAEPEPLTEHEWALRVARAAGWRGRLVVLPDLAVPRHLRVDGNLAQHWDVDSSRIRQELGYVEPVTQEEAIRRSVEWELCTLATVNDPAGFDYEAEDAAIAAAFNTEARRTQRISK